MTDAQTRQASFERQVVDADEKALPKCVDFAEHRFVSVERDATTGERYVKGHKSMRGACNHMARSVASGELFLPEAIIDLDNDSKEELELFVHVAPHSVDAVSVVMPRNMAESVAGALKSWPQLDALAQAVKLFERAVERRPR